MATLSVSTAHLGANVKSEPISPPRVPTPSGHMMRPPSTGHVGGHISPSHLSGGSNSSSPVEGLNTHYGNDGGPPAHKRPRVAEGWGT